MAAKGAVLTLSVILAYSGAVASAAASEPAACGDSHSYESHYNGRPLVAVFDDGAQADIALLSYEWTLDSRTEEEDRITVAWNLTVPEEVDSIRGTVIYFGDSAAAAAERGDFSFMQRFNTSQEQREAAHITRKGDDPNTVPTVIVPGPFSAVGSASVVVSRYQNALLGAEHEGMAWTMSVEPQAVPLEGNVSLPLLGLWPGGPVTGELRIVRPSDVPSSAAILDNLPDKDRWIQWATPWIPVSYGTSDAPRQIEQALVYAYDSRCGTFAGTASGFYTDDLLLTHLGLMSYRGSPDSIMVPVQVAGHTEEVPGWPVALVVAALAAVAVMRRP